MIVQLWGNSDDTGRIPVSMPQEYAIGDYVDLQVIRRSRTNYTIAFVGKTPETFIPENGENIG